MNLDLQNKSTLASIASGLSLLHIWLGLAYGWYLILNTGFFGTPPWGWLVASLVALLLLNPFVSMMIARYGLNPLILNLLEVGIISRPGCLSGIAFFLGEIIYIIWALTRDLTSAIWVFLLMPLAALLLALVVTALQALCRRIGWPPRLRH